jgi:hypothetical protein
VIVWLDINQSRQPHREGDLDFNHVIVATLYHFMVHNIPDVTFYKYHARGVSLPYIICNSSASRQQGDSHYSSNSFREVEQTVHRHVGPVRL